MFHQVVLRHERPWHRLPDGAALRGGSQRTGKRLAQMCETSWVVVSCVFLERFFELQRASKLQDIFGNHNFLLTEDCKTDLRPKEDWPGAKRSWHLGLQVVLVGLL